MTLKFETKNVAKIRKKRERQEAWERKQAELSPPEPTIEERLNLIEWFLDAQFPRWRE